MHNQKKNRPDNNNFNKKNRLIYLFLLLLIPSVLYFRVVSYDFSYLDDDIIIINHYKTINDLKNIKEAFTHDAFISNAGELYYRPLQTVSFMLDAQIGGQKPWIYHLTNLLLHILSVIALFFFLKKIGIKEDTSFILSAFFSVSPLLTNAVAWIPARGDLLLCLFTILSFITFLQYYENRKIVFLILHLFVIILAAFSKETAILIPVLILMHFFFVQRKEINIKSILPFLIIWLLSFSLYYNFRQSVVKVTISLNTIEFIHFIKNLPAIPNLFCKFFFPYSLSTMPFIDTITTINGVILLIIFTGLTIKIIKADKRISVWGAVWFLVFTIPPMFLGAYDTIIGWEYFEYRAYLPIIGILVIIGAMVDNLIVRLSFKKILMVIIPVFILYSIIAFYHSNEFADSISFYTSAVNSNPQNAMAYNVRGGRYFEAGNKDKALSDFDNAIRICNIYSNPYYNKGEYYKTLGDNNKAKYFYSKALNYDTLYHNGTFKEEDAYINLSAMTLNLKEYDEAKSILKKAIIIFPKSYKIFNNLGTEYLDVGNYDSAIISFNKTIELEPGQSAYNYRAIAKYHLKDYIGAISDLNIALKLNPEFKDALTNRGMIKIEIKDYLGAITDFNNTISLYPRSAVAYHYRGVAYSKLNNQVEAERDWTKAKNLGFRTTKK
jgi:protein O-mannosyl-transferase